jgi:sulfite reductase (NADPH) flavoprotein alpha-component
MAWWPGSADSIIAMVQERAASDFAVFLLLVGAAAALLALAIIGGVIGIAMIGDSRAPRQKLYAARLSDLAGAGLAGEATLDALRPKTPLMIIYATETGNAKGLADAAGRAASRLGFTPHVLDMADITPSEAARTENLLVIASTWGEGEPPQRATNFYDALMSSQAPRFEGVRFAVLALGDRAYASFSNFCETGRRLDARLAQLGGSRVAERSECDADYEAQASTWIAWTLTELLPFKESKAASAAGGSSSVIQVEPVRTSGTAVGPGGRTNPFDAEFTEKINLNSTRPSNSTFHIALALTGLGGLYEPGDSLGILPHNDPVLVNEMLNTVGLSGDAGLREAITTRYDITALTFPQLASYAELSGDKALSALAADERRAAEFVGGSRQLIDMLAAAPRMLTADQLIGLLRKLQPRLYSIASSRKRVGDQAHLLIAAVEYEAHGRTRKGVASLDVVERHHVGDRLRIYLHPNQHFRLPANPAQHIVMIGPGTGVAPFRAFMQERDAIGATGKNWLFFGHRHRAEDFFYQSEWQDFEKRGVLSRLDVAFSRDQPEKIYVQHRMWNARRDLYAWLQDGAVLYVCGNANTMARDVNSTLLHIAADQGRLDEASAQAWLAGLRQGGRYLRDVY